MEDTVEAHGGAEFDIPGITFGGRYDDSPAIVPDGSLPPAEAANTYVPSACPGGRAPHAWLGEGVSLYDRFGFEWTLLSLSGEVSSQDGDLKLLNLKSDEARELYGADYALVRPDQIVAWRGDDPRAGRDALRQLLG